jgi:mycothiol synthase
VLLYQEAKRLQTYKKTFPPKIVADLLKRPNYSPEQDLFVVEKAGITVGYMDMTLEFDLKRALLDCWLYPEHRRKGHSKELLNCAIRRSKELGIRMLHVNIMEDNTIAGIVLSKLGFKYVRRFFDLNLDTASINWNEANQASRKCYHLEDGEEIKLTRIQNLCFAGSWGYNPNTVATIMYRTHMSHFSPEDVLLTGEGDEVAGYCWTEVTIGMDEQEGRIYMLGVNPAYRRAGLGRRLLLAGLAHLRRKGVSMAMLTVDSENETAINLYQSIGFKIAANSLWYEKIV